MRSRRESDNRPESTPRQVTTILHALRGEHFRHARNLQLGTRPSLQTTHTYNEPSLPFHDIYQYADERPAEQLLEGTVAQRPAIIIQDGRREHDYPRGPVPGPPIPGSWSGLFKHEQGWNTLAFRREALSLVLSHLPWSFGSSDVPRFNTEGKPSSLPGSSPASPTTSIVSSAISLPSTSTSTVFASTPLPLPPLTQICLRVLLAEFPDAADFRAELLPLLPAPLRRDVLRYTAVHEPLPSAKLYALCAPDGHAAGELFVVGPQASVQRDQLVGHAPSLAVHREEDERAEDEDGDGDEGAAAGAEAEDDETEAGGSWDADEEVGADEPPPLHTLVVLNAVVSPSALFVFPLTLTRLALLALPLKAPVHRLPRLCPLLEVLDLSYNPWLNEPPEGRVTFQTNQSTLERIEWAKWTQLRVLGLRACNISAEVVEKVNKGRWDEVEVVGVADSSRGISVIQMLGRPAS